MAVAVARRTRGSQSKLRKGLEFAPQRSAFENTPSIICHPQNRVWLRSVDVSSWRRNLTSLRHLILRSSPFGISGTPLPNSQPLRVTRPGVCCGIYLAPQRSLWQHSSWASHGKSYWERFSVADLAILVAYCWDLIRQRCWLHVYRQELIGWLNQLLQLNMTKVEQCGTGQVTGIQL